MYLLKEGMLEKLMQFPQGEFPNGPFPYEQYETFTPQSATDEEMTVYYVASDETRARQTVQSIQQAQTLLSNLLHVDVPEMDVLFPTKVDWYFAPRAKEDAAATPDEEPFLPYWTDVVSPACLVVPPELDPTWGEETLEKLLFLIYHEIALAFLEIADIRDWPDIAPLWADEWQLKFAALWLSHEIDGVKGLVNTDLREEFEESFEPEADGKTPVTIRGFDWYDDTTPDEYLEYEILLEQFAADLLANYSPEILPDFLIQYRVYRERFLSDEVTKILASVLGPNGEEWLENLVYF